MSRRTRTRTPEPVSESRVASSVRNHVGLKSFLRATYKQKLANRPFYSSEEEEEEAAALVKEEAKERPDDEQVDNRNGYYLVDKPDGDVGSDSNSFTLRRISRESHHPRTPRRRRSKPSKPSLTERIFHHSNTIKQWQVQLAQQSQPQLARPVLVAMKSQSASRGRNDRYWSYTTTPKVGRDPGYTVTNHHLYMDQPPARMSPSLTEAELAALQPVPPGEACRQNGLTFIRRLRVKVKESTRAELKRVMRTVTGEVDRAVLSMCAHGHTNKCQIYRTDDYNFTLITTDAVLSGEPIVSWIGTLREKNTFVQRVGIGSSMCHTWSYDIGADSLPPGYTGPDLVLDGNEYGNESRFLRDPKWSHQQADANVAVRLVWDQRGGLPYLVYVALCDIAPRAELFLDWGADCWKTVWRVQLTALAANSHLCHVYLKRLQSACAAAGIARLPQHAHSKFAAQPSPDDHEKETQRRFLEEELSPFRTTTAKTLEKKPVTIRKTSTPTNTANITESLTDTPISASESDATSSGMSPPSTAQWRIPACQPVPQLSPPSASFDVAHAAASPSSTSPLSVRSTVRRSTRPRPQLQVDTKPPTPTPTAHDDTDSAPSSPYTPSFNTHKAFCTTTSHTMLTVFASAMLNESLSELSRVRRRLRRHRLNNFQRVKKLPKPILEGAMHVHGQHTFQLVEDPNTAFAQSGTRLGRECMVAVSEETRAYVNETFNLLSPQHFPSSRDARLIHDGTVPKSRIYEVVGLTHPARFFTRPDQTPFSLVAIDRYKSGEPIGVYTGVVRDFHTFHKATDTDAMKQVFAYDCLAGEIPGPPNPNLSPEEKKLPLDEQLSYRGGDMVIESLYYGNEIRFMNDAYGRSSSDGTVNAQAEIAWDCERQWPCILIRATVAIDKGDEIICDYGDSFWNKVARSLMMDHAAYGDEVKLLIEETESWLTHHHIPLPTRPTTRKELPTLFTDDIRQKEVIYPKYFMKEFDSAHDETISPSEAERILREGRARIEAARAPSHPIDTDDAMPSLSSSPCPHAPSNPPLVPPRRRSKRNRAEIDSTPDQPNTDQHQHPTELDPHAHTAAWKIEFEPTDESDNDNDNDDRRTPSSVKPTKKTRASRTRKAKRRK